MDDIRAAATALAAIEVVDTRFQSYSGTPPLDRLCDCMSNGALVCGAPREDWRGLDLARLPVTLTADGEVIARSVGGHANGDPLLPAVALANELRTGPGIAAGQIVTTGTFTGLLFARPGMRIVASFEGFAPVELTFAT